MPSGLGRLQGAAGDLDVLGARAGLQHLELGALLVALGFHLSQLRAVIAVGEVCDPVALADPLALVDEDGLNHPFDLGTDLGVVEREDFELSRHVQLQPDEEQKGHGEGQDDDELERPPHRADALGPYREQAGRRCQDSFERPAKHDHHETGVEEESGGLVALNEEAADVPRDGAQDREGVDPGHHAVGQVDSPLPRRRLMSGPLPRLP